MAKKCAACEVKTPDADQFFEDPCWPRMESGECLCRDCYCDHAVIAVEELEESITAIKETAEKAGITLDLEK